MSFHGSLSFWAQFRFFFSSSVLHNQKKYNNLVTQQCRPVFIINIRSSVYSIVFYYAISASISSTIFVSLFFFSPLKLSLSPSFCVRSSLPQSRRGFRLPCCSWKDERKGGSCQIQTGTCVCLLHLYCVCSCVSDMKNMFCLIGVSVEDP